MHVVNLTRDAEITQSYRRCSALTRRARAGFIRRMRFVAPVFALSFLALGASSEGAREEPRILEKVTALPIALSNDFQFRKTKLFFMSEKAPQVSQARQTTSTLGAKSTSPNQKVATLQDAPITFERQYRLFGAVTALDQRQRFGDYFDFFWRARRAVGLVVRLEHAEKLHSFVQAQRSPIQTFTKS
jgi:hypothetical protein